MQFRSLISAAITLTLIVLTNGCSSPLSTPTASAETGLNLLVIAEGKVFLQRESWSDFHPASFGAILYRGDQLRLAPNAEAVVLCENLTTWNVPGGSPSGLNNGCPQVQEPVLVSSGGLIANTRGGTDLSIPYIISPRATKLLSPNPIFRWNEVDNVQTYRLSLSGTDWQAETNDTQFMYPGNPPLQVGTDYLLIVEVDNGKSSRDEGLPGLGFSLLSDGEISRVHEETRVIEALNLTDDAKAFVLAQLYSGHHLYAEAIELLERSAEINPQVANIYRTLGNLYQQIGLLRLAELRYLRAHELATASDDVESETATAAKLGEVYLALGNKSEAHDWLEQARENYKKLGDSQRVNELEEQLAQLSK
jgi:hypothetical protein